MKYKIVWQEEKMGRESVPVQCKNVKMFPKHGAGGEVVGFGRLGFLLLQVIIEDEKGEQLRLKLSTSGGINYPKFIVQWPDTMEYPTYYVGQGKRRRGPFADTLAPKERKPGVKEEYDLQGFTERLTRFVGADMASEILQLFAERFAKLANKAAA